MVKSDWTTLSRDAQSVIEWVECPREGQFNLVTVHNNDEFRRTGYGVIIPITQDLFDEIRLHVSRDENLMFVTNNDDVISFRLTDEYMKENAIEYKRSSKTTRI